MLNLEKIAADLNLIGSFCGRRDIPELTPKAIKAFCGKPQAESMVLFGGSIIAGIDVLASAMQKKAAKTYIIAGGAGHTTETLRQKIHTCFPSLAVTGKSEAELFSACLQARYGLQVDFLETASTNCGNNITYLLNLLHKQQIPLNSIILSQDATMQQRMDAVLRKDVPDNTTIINFATYRTEIVIRDNTLCFAQDLPGMWSMERYITLLMGEIPRLRDDANGYGPRGKNYLAHLDIPAAVNEAFAELQQIYADKIRQPDARFQNSH